MKSIAISIVSLVLYYAVVVYLLRGALHYSFNIDVGNVGPFLFVLFLHMIMSVFLVGIKR